MSLTTRDVQRNEPVYTAGFSITLFRASFFIAPVPRVQASRHPPTHASMRHRKQSEERDMPAKRLEVMPTIAESAPADVTYDELSSATRGLQDRVRRQYEQNLEKRSDRASLRRLEGTIQRKNDRAAAKSARSDQESLRILEAATRAQKIRSSGRAHHESSRLKQATWMASLGENTSTSDGVISEPASSALRRSEVLDPVASDIDQANASTTSAAAKTVALRLEALSTLTTSATESFVEVDSSPSTPSSSLFRLPTRPVYQRALETDPGPSTAPARPWLPRVLTAFPEIGKLVGAVVPEATARKFTRVDSGAYSSDYPPSSGRPLKPVGQSRSPSWSSDEDVVKEAAKEEKSYHETPSRTSKHDAVQQSRKSSWMSEEAALAATQDDFDNILENHERSDSRSGDERARRSAQDEFIDAQRDVQANYETPCSISRHDLTRQSESPSWSAMEEALGSAKDDSCVETSSRISERSVQKPPFLHLETEKETSAPSEHDLDFAEERDERVPSEPSDDEHADSAENDFDVVDADEATSPSQTSLAPQLEESTKDSPPEAKTQQWLEDQLADAMGLSAPPRGPNKIQDEYADLFSPTLKQRIGSASGSINGEGMGKDDDRKVEEFEDWEDLGDEER